MALPLAKGTGSNVMLYIDNILINMKAREKGWSNVHVIQKMHTFVGLAVNFPSVPSIF